MLWTITEKILLSRVSMEIKIKVDSSVIRSFDILAELAQSCDFREKIFIQSIELAIKIFSAKTSSEISSNNSIRVQHRDDVKYEHSPQDIRRFDIHE